MSRLLLASLLLTTDALVPTRVLRPGRRRASEARMMSEWKTISPCPSERALALCPQKTADEAEEGTHWVAIERIQSAGDALAAALEPGAPEATVLVGAPAAVARLRTQRALVDKLLQSILKEDDECAVAVGHSIDALLKAWLEHVEASNGEQTFEDLRAAAQPHTAPVLEMRGFAEVEKVDMAALGRGEPIATHSARLPAAIVAYDALLVAETASPADRTVYTEILELLRKQPPPGIARPGKV